ncbi:unnamed protein product [Diplocarpon coronariae]
MYENREWRKSAGFSNTQTTSYLQGLLQCTRGISPGQTSTQLSMSPVLNIKHLKYALVQPLAEAMVEQTFQRAVRKRNRPHYLILVLPRRCAPALAASSRVSFVICPGIGSAAIEKIVSSFF